MPTIDQQSAAPIVFAGAGPAAHAVIAAADTRRPLPSPEARVAALPHHAAGVRAAERALHHAGLWAALEAAGERSYASAHGFAAAAEAGAAAASFIAAQKAADEG